MTARSRWPLLMVAAALLLGPAAAADPVPPTQVREAQWYLDPLGITKAHAVTKGEGVTVCLVDSGVKVSHPALAGTHVQPGWDASGAGSPDGFTPVGAMNQSHGTAMAALIGAQGAEGGLLGSAPGASIRPVSTTDAPSTVAGLKWCADQHAKVISLSQVATVPWEAVRYLQARDVVLVAGTGNDFSTSGIGTPAAYFGVLSVDGVGSDLTHDPMTNSRGPSINTGAPSMSFDLQGVAVAGPSAVTSSPDRASCVGLYTPLISDDGYARRCGSSNATAVVAGVVALVRAKHPELNAANVINRVLKTATPPPGGETVPSPRYGWGVVNAEKAVSADVPLVTANPLGSYYTESMGLWNPAVAPKRAEPPVGATLAPADIKAPVTGETWDTGLPSGASGASDAGGAGIPGWAYAVGGGAVAILLVIGAAVALLRRGKKAAT